MKPGLHREFQIDERVTFEVAPGIERSGTITGIAMQHIIFTYIITLDGPLYVPEYDKPWKTVVMPGGCLRQAHGK